MITEFQQRGLLHIETELGIVNIYCGLTDMKGRRVERVNIIPDNYIGENKVALRGWPGNRLVQLKSKR